MELYEKHRPHTLDGVVGQPGAVDKCRRLVADGLKGKAIWLSGPSGSGKTTIARILAAEVADGQAIMEYDSPDLANSAEMDLWARCFSLMGAIGSTKPGWAVIINEAHGLNAAQIRRLLGVLETAAQKGKVLFIFTTTTEAMDNIFGEKIDASPLLSRCHEVKLTGQGLCKAFALHVQKIAICEGLDGQPTEAYEALAKRCHNNARAMLQKVAAGEMRKGA
jgi:replication-associated recombination protein RarA